MDKEMCKKAWILVRTSLVKIVRPMVLLGLQHTLTSAYFYVDVSAMSTLFPNPGLWSEFLHGIKLYLWLQRCRTSRLVWLSQWIHCPHCLLPCPISSHSPGTISDEEGGNPHSHDIHISLHHWLLPGHQFKCSGRFFLQLLEIDGKPRGLDCTSLWMECWKEQLQY